MDATEEGIAASYEGADQQWKEDAFAAVKRVAAAKSTFTPDDIWDEVEKPREPRALGGVMRRAMREGVCEPTGNYVKSRIPSQHKNIITEYRSL